MTLKNAFIFIITITVLLLIVFLMVAYSKEDYSTLYSIPAIIKESDKDTIIIKDLRGEVWVFNNDCEWTKGNKVTVIFDSFGTGNLIDDKIIAINWIGEYNE